MTGEQGAIIDRSQHYAVIGAGPAGLSAARNLQRFDVLFDGFEAHSDVGGLWDINNPRSTVYESAHLISSKKMTEFTEFPMPPETPDYPDHAMLARYFRDFARHFGLYEYYRFDAPVERVWPEDNVASTWLLRLVSGETFRYRGVLIANGTLAEPNRPGFSGQFSGRLMHSSEYKSARIFDDQRVLIVGAGNSGCDIAVDALHRAKSVDMSLRRGYHFVPKYMLGKPADQLGGGLPLPRPLKQRLDRFLLRLFTGDPERFGFPRPDHALYESHPIVNSLVLYHAGHGDLGVRGDINEFDGHSVRFADGSVAEYDLVLLATGYKLHYPFIDREHLNWQGASPGLYLNVFHPVYDNLFVLGMVEATGLGWQGRHEQAEMVARFVAAREHETEAADWLRRRKAGANPDLSGGYHYLKLDRMAYYVHKDTYLREVRRVNRELARQ